MSDASPDIYDRYVDVCSRLNEAQQQLETARAERVRLSAFAENAVVDYGQLQIQLDDAQRSLEDMTVQALFWKQAAEHAVDGWTKQEDVCIALRELLLKACNAGLIWAARGTEARELLEKLKAEVLADNGDDT